LFVPLSFYEFSIQDEELEFFGLVEVIKHKKNEKTGRPLISVEITEKGRDLL